MVVQFVASREVLEASVASFWVPSRCKVCLLRYLYNLPILVLPYNFTFMMWCRRSKSDGVILIDSLQRFLLKCSII